MDLLRRAAPRLTARCTDAALAGFALLVITGVITSATLPLQGDVYADPALVALGIVMFVLKPLVLVLPWRSWHPMAPLAMPITMIVGLTGLSVLGGDLGPLGFAYVGMYFMAFVHTGVWLPARASWWLLVPAAASYPLLVGAWDRHVALRMAVVVVVWVMAGELVSHLQARQRATEEVLRAATRRDALTRLDNRRGLAARLEDLVGGEVVVMLDLDHFKAVNDTRGHAGGDAVLADFAEVLSGQLRHGDHSARYGGEEFVLVLADTGLDEAVGVLGRLRTAWASVEPEVTFSSGYVRHEPGTAPALSIGLADAALYAAKASGRNRDVPAEETSGHRGGRLHPGLVPHDT